MASCRYSRSADGPFALVRIRDAVVMTDDFTGDVFGMFEVHDGGIVCHWYGNDGNRKPGTGKIKVSTWKEAWNSLNGTTMMHFAIQWLDYDNKTWLEETAIRWPIAIEAFNEKAETSMMVRLVERHYEGKKLKMTKKVLTKFVPGNE